MDVTVSTMSLQPHSVFYSFFFFFPTPTAQNYLLDQDVFGAVMP